MSQRPALLVGPEPRAQGPRALGREPAEETEEWSSLCHPQAWEPGLIPQGPCWTHRLTQPSGTPPAAGIGVGGWGSPRKVCRSSLGLRASEGAWGPAAPGALPSFPLKPTPAPRFAAGKRH